MHSPVRFAKILVVLASVVAVGAAAAQQQWPYAVPSPGNPGMMMQPSTGMMNPAMGMMNQRDTTAAQ